MAFSIEYHGDDHSGLATFLESAVARYSDPNGGGWVVGLSACIGYADDNVKEVQRDFVLDGMTDGRLQLRRFDDATGAGIGEPFEFDAEDIDTVEVY